MVDFCQFLSDFVNLGCVFQRADGKGGGKIVIAALFCQFCCFFHAEAVAFEAAFATFGYVFEPLPSGRIPVGRSDPLSV